MEANRRGPKYPLFLLPSSLRATLGEKLADIDEEGSPPRAISLGGYRRDVRQGTKELRDDREASCAAFREPGR